MGPFQLGEKIWMKISQRDALDALAPVGRRDFVKVLIGGGALVIGNFASAGASEAANRPIRGELFAFLAPDTSDLVFAVAFPMMSDDGVPQTVRIHASSRSWTVAVIDPLSALVSARAGDRIFVGQIAGSMPSGHAPHRLVVVSTPATTFPAGGLQVWAEVSGLDGLPTRIGNPIIAEFLAQDSELTRAFDNIHPSRDRTLFADALAKRIAARGASTDPQAHSQRLASIMLPNTLSFDPRQPVGFTFAAQNGRRPGDAIAGIVDTVLAGAATPARDSNKPFRAANTFPYFQSATA
jgi:hypothetical protein